VLGLTTTSTPSTDATIKVLGVRYQITNKLTSTLAYYDGDYKNGVGSQGTYKNFVLLNDYALSKRTNLYASLDQGRSTGALNQSNNGSNTGIMTGIRHLF
jgi:predicted porin